MSVLARVALVAVGCVALLVLFGAPLTAWPPVVRLPAVLVPALALTAALTRPWSWPDLAPRAAEWQPSRRLVWSGAAVVGVLLFWYLLTRFHSGQINAVDFTIYYDRPCFQTVHGRPLFVEHSDTPGFSHRSELADHGYWGMLAVCSLYALHPSPLWLHAVSVIAVVMGAVGILRVLQRVGTGGAVATAAALAYVLNDNTARTLNYGFHPEVLYAGLVPWMIEAGLRSAWRPFLATTLACVLVKEDAFLPIFGVSVVIALNRLRAMTRAERWLFLVLPTAVALANLAFYYGYVVPLLTGQAHATYAHFWGNYGHTPMRALFGMCRHPVRVAQGTLTSGIFRVLEPHLFLPLVGWRSSLGIAPIVALYGASANGQVRSFALYYAIVLVPFLVMAEARGALTLARRLVRGAGRAHLLAGGAILLGAVLVGSGDRGYSLRPWRREIAAVPAALAGLADEPIVLVQSGLFTRAGYDERFRLLTPETLHDPRHVGAVVLLAADVPAYPFEKAELADLLALPTIRPMPANLTAVRLCRRGGGEASGR